MGANGTHSSGALSSEENRKYDTIGTIDGNTKILVPKDKKRNGKLPEESHTSNRVYVSFYTDGHDVKEIAKYGEDGKKLYAIHTADHKGISPHYHQWQDGRQLPDAHPITPEMQNLLNYIRNYGNN
jgi:hypothetical protein